MTEVAFARYFCAFLVVFGLVILGIAFADRPWLIGLILVLAGVVIGAPLWKWHFDDMAEQRETARLRPMTVPDEEPQV